MKPAPFGFVSASALTDVARVFAGSGGARVMAGGQSLGPMLNLRVARPETIVSILGLPNLGAVEETADAVTVGACITHAQIADGLIPDIGQNVLPRIAQGIAYRAVRNRGTIGGSLCHADPAADWLCTLTALGATILAVRQADGKPPRRRAIPLSRFVAGAFRNVLDSGEIVEAVRIPRLAPDARWGYFKACRKPGEFAHAMVAALRAPQSGFRRAVIGAVGGPPLILEGADCEPEAAERILGDASTGLDAIGRHMQVVALKRALAMAGP
jgi:carbon-monoxide dehydrogenase medium subunit